MLDDGGRETREIGAGDQILAQLRRQARSGGVDGRNRDAAEDVIQEFQFEAAADQFGNDGDARLRQERREVFDEAFKPRRAAGGEQCLFQIVGYVTGDDQLDAIRREPGVSVLDEASQVFAFHDPLERADDNRTTRHGGVDDSFGRNGAVVARRQRKRVVVAAMSAERLLIFDRDGRHQVDAHAATDVPGREPCNSSAKAPVVSASRLRLAWPWNATTLLRDCEKHGPGWSSRRLRRTIRFAAIQRPARCRSCRRRSHPTAHAVALRAAHDMRSSNQRLRSAESDSADATAVFRRSPGTDTHSMRARFFGVASVLPKPSTRTNAPACASASESFAEYTFNPSFMG